MRATLCPRDDRCRRSLGSLCAGSTASEKPQDEPAERVQCPMRVWAGVESALFRKQYLEHFSLMRHRPAPPPDHPQGILALGGREGERAGAGSTHLKNALARGYDHAGSLRRLERLPIGRRSISLFHYIFLPSRCFDPLGKGSRRSYLSRGGSRTSPGQVDPARSPSRHPNARVPCG